MNTTLTKEQGDAAHASYRQNCSGCTWDTAADGTPYVQHSKVCSNVIQHIINKFPEALGQPAPTVHLGEAPALRPTSAMLGKIER